VEKSINAFILHRLRSLAKTTPRGTEDALREGLKLRGKLSLGHSSSVNPLKQLGTGRSNVDKNRERTMTKKVGVERFRVAFPRWTFGGRRDWK